MAAPRNLKLLIIPKGNLSDTDASAYAPFTFNVGPKTTAASLVDRIVSRYELPPDTKLFVMNGDADWATDELWDAIMGHLHGNDNPVELDGWDATARTLPVGVCATTKRRTSAAVRSNVSASESEADGRLVRDMYWFT